MDLFYSLNITALNNHEFYELGDVFYMLDINLFPALSSNVIL